MQFVLATKEKISKEEGSRLLQALSELLETHDYTVYQQEVSEIDMKETKIGDSNLVQEHFFESKITRKVEPKKRKDCSKEICSIED